ncbi:MAG: T9SS type A sorting domain-containing protein [Chitinophagaceae bacterium]
MKAFSSAKTIVSGLVKRTALFLLFISSPAAGFAQVTTLSGVVNTYHKVTEIIPAKGCLRVANPAGLNVNTLVMVIQMKGAAINTTATSSFGDTTSLNGAGNYEIGAICYLTGDSVFLFHKLMNNYDVNAKVQLVQFSQQYSTTIVDTVKAASWDSTTGLGGVIAIYADQSITLNAPIYADSSGYSGGAYIYHAGDCPFVGTGYVYDASATGGNNGAYKGESVAIIAASQDGAKGAPANGGGGGNNHNNSGAGGANLTAGGNGGGNSSSGPFGCNTGGNYGRGGKPLSSWNGYKLFSGGGGGAGHANNGSVTSNYGGNGGGIIFIWASDIIGNGYSISARGGKGGGSQSDGAGGGGAGGTIVLNADTYTGSTFVNVNGGDGGLSDDGTVTGRCFGGGGGGSGGVVYFKGGTPGISVAVSGGVKGNEISREATCNAAVPGADGSAGLIIPNYTFSRSVTASNYCLLLLPVKLLYFKAQYLQEQVVLNWEVDYPELAREFSIERKINDNIAWSPIYTGAASGNRHLYAAFDQHPSGGNNFYRLKITEKTGRVYYSDIRKIWKGSNSNDLTIYPNPSHGQATVSGQFETGNTLVLTDISGKMIWKKNITTRIAEAELPLLSPGIYLLQYNKTVRKLIVQ